MKNAILFLLALVSLQNVSAQENLNELLAAGINDSKRFAEHYIKPANDGLAYGINNNWSNSAKSQKKFGFTLSLVGNATFINDEDKQFIMNTDDYENIRFKDGSVVKPVATALGHNEEDVIVEVTYDDPIFGEQTTDIILPTGIGSANVNLIPTVFLQGSFTPFKGTEIKARYFPKVEQEDVEVGLYGFGLQHEFTSWLPADNNFPVAVSGLVAYTQLNGSYNLINTSNVEGENQRVETETKTMLYQLVVGTNLKIFNVYGSVGYLDGQNETDLLGRYRVSDGFLFTEEIVDPFSVESETTGVVATVGAQVKLGFFGVNAAYTIADFSSASLGMNFSF